MLLALRELNISPDQSSAPGQARCAKVSRLELKVSTCKQQVPRFGRVETGSH